jgi:mono/diheme cytochrome c family protein
MSTARIRLTTTTLVLGLTLTGAATGAEPERGQLLYENHCSECHTTFVHFREMRKAQSIADIRTWVERWQADLKLEWHGEEVEDVTRYLNARFYNFADTR